MESLYRFMKVLSKQELKVAEEALSRYLPQSQQAYGYVFLMNRVKVDPTDVLVDQWPDFRVLIIQPGQQQKPNVSVNVCIFTKDASSLRDILTRTVDLDWKPSIRLSVDQQHEELLRAVTVNKGVPMIKSYVIRLMKLHDPSKLIAERFSFEVSSVKESHAALINSKWAFGMGELTEPMVRGMIRNFPSYCVLDKEGQPLSWVLTYASAEMGVMYTLPEHRRKGYNKAVTTTLIKKLISEGYPFYCCVEENNQASYRHLTRFGFTEVPSYKNALILI